MPVYNTARYVRAALVSISEQSFADFELVVVDDGSTDETPFLLREHATAEPRMRLVVRANRGLVATRNELLSLACGDFLAWMDSDDISLPERLARQVAAFDADPDLACVGCFAQCIDPDGNALRLETYPVTHDAIVVEQQKGGAMRFATTMVRRETAVASGGFRGRFLIGEDFDFLLRVSEIGHMANLPVPLYLYRQHVGSACARFGSEWVVSRDRILDLARQRKELGYDDIEAVDVAAPPRPIERREMRRRVADIYASWARDCLANGNRPIALRHAMSALRSRPNSLAAWKVLLRLALRVPRLSASTPGVA